MCFESQDNSRIIIFKILIALTSTLQPLILNEILSYFFSVFQLKLRNSNQKWPNIGDKVQDKYLMFHWCALRWAFMEGLHLLQGGRKLECAHWHYAEVARQLTYLPKIWISSPHCILKNEGHESKDKGRNQFSGKVAQSICYKELREGLQMGEYHGGWHLTGHACCELGITGKAQRIQ